MALNLFIMTTIKIYSGQIRTYSQCRANHIECLGPGRECHYNDLDNPEFFYTHDEFDYKRNKIGETWPDSTLNQWHNNWLGFCKAPKGFDVYIRMRYDIRLTGVVRLEDYPLDDDVVYIPSGHDYHDGVNDQMAFGNYEAMRRYYSVYLLHPLLFHLGKVFHTESYLKYALDHQRVRIVRLPVETQIIR